MVYPLPGVRKSGSPSPTAGLGVKVMAKKRKRMRKRPARPRDPFWRLRRALGERKVRNRRAYDRAGARKAEQEAKNGDD